MITHHRLAALIFAIAMSAPTALAAEQPATVVHGADSQFSNATVKVAWVVRKGASEESTQVVIRLVNVAESYRWIRLDGVDPFSKARIAFVPARPLESRIDLVVPRKAFADHPSAEIQLFRSEADALADRPALTIFYLGVPDTTPEFANTDDAERYLAHLENPPEATR